MDNSYDVIIIGGGPAGMAAAMGARQEKARRILIIERDKCLGGVLPQCIHSGFGLHRFGEELTGPEYARREIKRISQLGIDVLTDTTVIEIAREKIITAVNPGKGVLELQAKAVVLAMGCRERTRGALRIPGSRPAGILTAGAAQRMVNLEGYLPGKEVVILGSGDIGLIMARRMTLEGAKVKAVLEIMPYANGLTRNLVQCLEDFNIPLFLSHTIVNIHGCSRVTGVTCAKVDTKHIPVPGSEFHIACDCLLLSVGLIPENELSRGVGIKLDPVTGGPKVDQNRQTSVPGIFAAGNVVQVHDLVDWVSEEGMLTGKYAAKFAHHGSATGTPVIAGAGVRAIIPQMLTRYDHTVKTIDFFLRVSEPGNKLVIEVENNAQTLFEQRLPVAKPSEMIRLKIPAAGLRQLTGPLFFHAYPERRGT